MNGTEDVRVSNCGKAAYCATLFISRNIDYQAILDFVSKFRERENKARVTIVCVYDSKALNPHTIELLKIAGVDYFVKKEVIDDTLDQYIKELSHILS